MPQQPTITEQTKPTDASTDSGGEWIALLYNDDVHTFDEVVQALMAATRFPAPHCVQIMLTAHHRGVAEVTRTTRGEAQRIVAVLRDSGLRAEAVPADVSGN